MRAAKWLGAMATVLGLVALSPAVRAEPATAGTLQLGLGFRYGVELNDSELNPWGTGLGFDLGYTMKNAVYLGGNFEYFFGETISALGNEVSSNLWQATAEGGYDVGLGDSIVIRPKLGLGAATVMSEVCIAGVCEDDSQGDFVLAPGATFLLLTRSFSLSFDVRYDMIFAEPELAKALIFSVGIGF